MPGEAREVRFGEQDLKSPEGETFDDGPGHEMQHLIAERVVVVADEGQFVQQMRSVLEEPATGAKVRESFERGDRAAPLTGSCASTRLAATCRPSTSATGAARDDKNQTRGPSSSCNRGKQFKRPRTQQTSGHVSKNLGSLEHLCTPMSTLFVFADSSRTRTALSVSRRADAQASRGRRAAEEGQEGSEGPEGRQGQEERFGCRP